MCAPPTATQGRGDFWPLCKNPRPCVHAAVIWKFHATVAPLGFLIAGRSSGASLAGDAQISFCEHEGCWISLLLARLRLQQCCAVMTY
mmetsp:Transcript_173208/g.555518  ORF Transcript_173208/g.555518 Transcript_173208/m.555518 type:complete len:88 (+) Transcript_173208:101-364(+)